MMLPAWAAGTMNVGGTPAAVIIISAARTAGRLSITLLSSLTRAGARLVTITRFTAIL